jgi:predicted transcriptional regulator
VTSFRQIQANRRNALRSTGPTTEDGKSRSRQNAVRHGLSAETVVQIVEDIDDYRGFEAAIIADYDARTAVERELVLRLASLLWRLRRATMIETELLGIQAEVLRDRRLSHLAAKSRNTASPIPGDAYSAVQDVQEDQAESDPWLMDHSTSRLTPQSVNSMRDLAHCFLRLANLDNGVFERLGRYESALSRQLVRILFLLKSARMS